MKLILLFSLLFSQAIFSKELDDFNKHLQEGINNYIHNNPEKYENPRPSRAPASVDENNDRPKKLEKDSKRIQDFHEQGIGLPKW